MEKDIDNKENKQEPSLKENKNEEKHLKEYKNEENKDINIKENNSEEKNSSTSKENSEDKKSLISKESKILIWMAVVLIIVFFASYYFFKNFNNFEYRGLDFTRQKYGDLIFYQSYYYFPDSLGNPKEYRLNLRIDPRENNVTTLGEIKFPRESILYLSANETGFESCPSGEKASAVSSFVLFLKGSKIEVVAASPDKNIAVEKNITYATCENRSPKSVILLQNSDETKIDATGNCFVIDVSNCEFLLALEKFTVEILAQAKERGSF